MRAVSDLFSQKKPVIGCIHLLPLPGAPLYDGDMSKIYRTALQEADILCNHGLDGLIIENFRDIPFYPSRIPAETVAAMSAVAREIVRIVDLPVGINALRNDAESALCIAAAAEAQFIRVNVHMNAYLTDQGIIEGQSHKTLRLRSSLKSDILIFADVNVKHAAPIADRGLIMETMDIEKRGLGDALIVSGERTGAPLNVENLKTIKNNTGLPVFTGSGTAPDNLHHFYPLADGFIVGTFFKKKGISENLVDESRVALFMDKIVSLKNPRHEKPEPQN